MTPIDLDRQRQRWTDARRIDHLDIANTETFAAGGLGAHVETLDLRIRLLPTDPMAQLVSLDDATGQWLSQSRPSPFGGGEPEFGQSKRATSNALVRYDQYRDDQGWRRFLGLHRDGGLDFGQGNSIASQRDERFVMLRPIVGLVWHLAAMQLDAVEKWHIEGPFEVSVALAGVEHARLGGFAEGWRDVGDTFYRDAPACLEPNVLLRIECDTLDPEALAMNVGDQLENTFGSTHRRYIANQGPFQDHFDPRF